MDKKVSKPQKINKNFAVPSRGTITRTKELPSIELLKSSMSSRLIIQISLHIFLV